MDHVVCIDYKARELEHLKSGKKTMIIRGAMGRKLPYKAVSINDVLYLIENKGDGMVKAKALVKDVFNSDKLAKEESEKLVLENQDNLLLDERLLNKYTGKRYIVLITIKDFETIEPFKIDRSDYGNMDDWLPVGNISDVKIK